METKAMDKEEWKKQLTIAKYLMLSSWCGLGFITIMSMVYGSFAVKLLAGAIILTAGFVAFFVRYERLLLVGRIERARGKKQEWRYD